MNNSRYSDQVVLVTGGAQGLGRAMVERFSAEGATVHFADLNDAAAQDVVNASRDGSTIYSRVDITDRSPLRPGSTTLPKSKAA